MKRSFKKNLLLLGTAVLCLTIPSCGGGGGDGGNSQSENDSYNSSGSSSSSNSSGSAGSTSQQQMLIPSKYSSATLTITCPNFEGTFELGRGSGGNNGTATSQGEFKVLGTEGLRLRGTLDGSWKQESYTKGEFKLQLYGRYNDGAGRLDALNMILRHSASASSPTIAGNIAASGTVCLTLYGGFASGFGSPIPLQSGSFTLTYK